MTFILKFRRSLPHCLSLIFLFACLPITAGAATYVVTNTNDSGPGSLRQAMLDANANTGLDSITFNIGSGLKTIAPTSQLPHITDPVVIDGTTQPGFASNPLIEIDASNIPSLPNAAVLFVTSGNTTVRSLILNHFKDGGISLAAPGGNHIEGCYIGIDSTGNAGTNSSGNGITISDSSNNVIGGTTANTRNVIGAIDFFGISVSGSSATGNQIQGNYIGINAAGTDGLAVFGGIILSSSNNTVGGTTPAARNVIGTGDYAGIVMQTGGLDISGNVVQGNYVGTDASGTIKLGFSNWGIAIFTHCHNNVIGGTTPGAGNLVSGNGWGIGVSGSGNSGANAPTGNVIQGNLIGVAADGVTPLSNSFQGIHLGEAFNTTVGGTAAGAGNIIAFNGPTAETGIGNGVQIFEGDGNSIRGNSIFSNGRLGIDLGANGITPNDPGDADAGPNKYQNFPLITSVVSNSGQTTILGTLNSTPNTTFNIDFYSNAMCDPSGNGEGAMPFGSSSAVVTTDANGNGTFNITFPVSLPAGRVLTATATDPSGNTSEFSACDASQTMGSVHFSPGSYTVIEDVGFVPVTVTRTGGIGSLTVNYATADRTAKAGEDYVATSGTLTFAAGETTKTFNVTILDDAILEPDESLVVTLKHPTDPDVIDNPGIAEITLKDKSVVPLISVSNLSVAEGDTGTTNANFVVSLSLATGRVVTVDYSTQSGLALSGVDFQPVSGTISFGPREINKTITVPVVGDTLYELNENFRLSLSNAVNGLIGNFGTATILDDDPPPTASISDVSVVEGNSGTTAAVFTVRLSTISGRTALVNYATADGTATSGSDYTATTGAVFFLPGELEKTFSVTINGDTQTEENETILVNLNTPNGATIQRGTGTATILDDDGSTPPLQLLLDESGPDPIQAAALDSMLLLRDPFPVVNSLNVLNQGPDRNTRILLFVKNLQLGAGVVVRLIDGNNQLHDIPAEDVRALPDFMQVTFRLPDGLTPGKYTVEVRANGKSSNSANFRIRN